MSKDPFMESVRALIKRKHEAFRMIVEESRGTFHTPILKRNDVSIAALGNPLPTTSIGRKDIRDTKRRAHDKIIGLRLGRAT